jgi:hypothetical protein
MKYNRLNYFLALLIASGMLASCVTTSSVSTTTAPDGTVTVTETKTSGPDATSVAAAGNAAILAASFIPRPQVIREK